MVESCRGYADTARRPSSEGQTVINNDRYKVPSSRHVDGRQAGKNTCDPPLAGAGFVIPARRRPPGLLLGAYLYHQLVSLTDDDKPPKANDGTSIQDGVQRAAILRALPP